MHAVGLDILEIQRVQQALDRWGERFLNRVFTSTEIAIYRHRVPELAVRFAGKEAVMKALGTGNRGIAWREIEILSNRRGQPQVVLHGRAKERAERLGLTEFAISLSHSNEFAIASVLGASQ
jgi:holo-[acyl-carrier protein] synthase